MSDSSPQPNGNACSDNRRCLMVAAAGMLVETGYTIRVWLALRAILEVQSGGTKRPVLLSFESPRHLKSDALRSALKQKADSLGVELICRTLLPKKLPVSDRLNRRHAAGIIRKIVRSHDIGIVHGQSHHASAYAACAVDLSSGVRLVFDAHGADIAERLDDGRLLNDSAGLNRARQWENEAWGAASSRIVVSSALGKDINARANYDYSFHVVPCVNTLDTNQTELGGWRNESRAELGFKEQDHVALYLGGSSAWQQPALIMSVFKEMARRDERTKLLVITGDPDYFQAAIRSANISADRCQVRSVPHALVPRLACAADIGFLLRSDNIINRVASPTKFAEYLALGVPVLLTEALEDFAEIVKAKEVGIVVGSDDTQSHIASSAITFLNRVYKSRARVRADCSEVAKNELSFQSILPVYKKIYGCES